MKNFKHEDYKYLDEYKLELPQLVLAVHDIDNHYKFKATKKWLKIAHQTAGHGCNQHYMIATILNPTKTAKKLMKELNNIWLDSDCGVFGVELDSIKFYREKLLSYNLDCNNSYHNFEEGIYPIDFTNETLRKLTNDSFPTDLDNLIKFDTKISKFCGSINRFHLYILGENCD